jgi:hypothetical protein
MTIRKALILMRSDGEVLVAEALSSATELYLLFGIESWTLVDEKGRPLPPSQANIRAHLLTQLDAAITVADRADDLYTEAVVLPLLVEAASFSQPTPTIPPTSAPTPTSDSPMPFSPSSTITSPTADTATTTSPLVGVSS